MTKPSKTFLALECRGCKIAYHNTKKVHRLECPYPTGCRYKLIIEQMGRGKMKRLRPFSQRTAYSCGPARVRSLIDYWEGIDIPEKELRDELCSTPDWGTVSTDIIQFFKDRGYKATGRTGMKIDRIAYWLKREVPILVCFADHYWIVCAMTKTHIVLLNGKVHVLLLTDFVKKWHEKGINGEVLESYGVIIRRDN